MMDKKKQRQILRVLRSTFIAGALTAYSFPVMAAISNNMLPQDGHFIHGNGSIVKPNENVMNIVQNGQNAVIKWGDFSIGSMSTVNFDKTNGGIFNVLNYIDSGKISQIYGTINAKNGNVFIANTAGTIVGKSASINVGSLYVSNKKMSDENLNAFYNGGNNPTIQGQLTNAQIMNLGHIEANKISFEGDRIVLDIDKVKGNNSISTDINIHSQNADNVVIGYTAYDKANKTYANKEKNFNITKIDENGNEIEKQSVKGYMWIDNVEQLQNMNTNLSGNYALHSNIDALNTNASIGDTFIAIGDENKAFTGKLDGLMWQDADITYGIFDLNVTGKDKNSNNVGLFGVTDGASIKNLLLSGGSSTGENNIGSIVGLAKNTTVENVVSSSNVTGKENVGGIVGNAINNTNGGTYSGLVNAGNIKGETNVGGIVGSITGGKIINSKNMGHIEGLGNSSHNIGGIVGLAKDKTSLQEVKNYLTIVGGYNVGGIIGSGENIIIDQAENNGNITAKGYTQEEYYYHAAGQNGLKHEKVHVANVGGIIGNLKDGKVTNVLNEKGNIQSSLTDKLDNPQDKNDKKDWYIAGNVGGIVGRAESVSIENAINKENHVYGAHNIGGIAGYMTGTSNIISSTNHGGEIMGTGARNDKGFVKETIKNGSENFIIGNIGGIVGDMYGNDVFLDKVGNRGHVHSRIIDNVSNVRDSAKAANVGGIAGKVDRNKTLSMEELKQENAKAAISNSYNTGNIQGYTGVGGIAGLMYNGEIKTAYNAGTLSTTRQSSKESGSVDPLNMGGIVGDSSDVNTAKISLYDVYNTGQIGDKEYNFFGRHVGGIVGRLSGDIEKSYNLGDIYNGYNVVGGIAGYLAKGNIKNSFNAGNITIVNQNDAPSALGGIVGTANIAHGDVNITNVYNLGALRAFRISNKSNSNMVGGIIGRTVSYDDNNTGNLNLTNIYSVGNIASFDLNQENKTFKLNNSKMLIVGGHNGLLNNLKYKNVHYIKAFDSEKGSLNSAVFGDIDTNKIVDKGNNIYSEFGKNQNTEVKVIEFADRNKKDQYNFTFTEVGNFDVKDENKDLENSWRIYEDNTMPILNAYLPNAEKYLGNNHEGITSIQYGTAYNPLLTIINANGTNTKLEYDWNKLNAEYNASFSVHNADLTLNNVQDNAMYYSGAIYSDGDLKISAKKGTDLMLGRGARLYGSTVTIDTATDDLGNGGNMIIYGEILAHGAKGKGDIVLNSAKDAEIMGSLTTVKEGTQSNISGLGQGSGFVDENGEIIKEQQNEYYKEYYKNLAHPQIALPDRGALYQESTAKAKGTGTITITAQNNLNAIIGVNTTGKITSASDLNLNAKMGNIYVDSDLNLDGNLNLSAKNGEALLDISNIGKVKTNDNDNRNVIDFLEKLNTKTGTQHINAKDSKKFLVTIDLWKDNKFDFDQYGNHEQLEKAFANAGLQDKSYIWISDVEQLASINDLPVHNFALKNDIDATGYNDFKAIENFSGIFDGRSKKIIGLNVDGGDTGKTGIFAEISSAKDPATGAKQTGVVKNLSVIGGKFKGRIVGAVAGVNNGIIDSVTTFGNRITGLGNTDIENANFVGGIVGLNKEIVNRVNGTDIVLTTAKPGVLSIVGGIVGSNSGLVENVISNSAVSGATTNINALGGVVGGNFGNVNNTISQGTVNGLYKDKHGKILYQANNVGGIVGLNGSKATQNNPEYKGNIHDAYSESKIHGYNNIGGIVGKVEAGSINNVANAGDIKSDSPTETHSKYTGGLAGIIVDGELIHGRNTANIKGEDYVGGIVGGIGKEAVLQNLINDGSSVITGDKYVGGVTGQNEGIIEADNSGLINKGEIYGNQYVGGIAGQNNGTIKNTVSNITLHAQGNNAKYFGGVTGENNGTIEDATNTGAVVVENAQYVGGITGKNNGTLNDAGNTGSVIGGNNVGGVAGMNDEKGTIKGEISNKGKVEATNGGAGGIFGENKANADGVTLINNGTVIGEGDTGTGGLIGINSGNFTHSSLINSVDGKVSGGSNVGGLIGINSANIIGGREQKNEKGEYIDAGLYVNKIYNNGVIEATGDNVGGLIGKNLGKVVAGYNTGAVHTTGENVGGIVGLNEKEGSLDQVFNAVMTKDGKAEFIGSNLANNVGGLIGNNKGSISNAYNTTAVQGNTVIGNAIGINDGTVTNIFDVTNTKGTLIGQNNNTKKTQGTFSLTKETWDTNVQLEQEKIKDKDAYNSALTDEAIWKYYDGFQTPLLKVFLTNANLKPNINKDFVYNGKEQGLNVDNISANDKLNAYYNANSLLQALTNKDAGENYLAFVSSQIAKNDNGEFNPNNLGYDIDVDYNIKKAILNITLDDINRIYGDVNHITNKNDEKKPSHFIDENYYGYTIDSDNLTTEMIHELNSLNHKVEKDNAIKENDEIHTNNVGDYTWSASFDLGDLAKNYQFDDKGSSKITVDNGKSTVSKANLTVNLGDVNHQYGKPNLNDYGIKDSIGLTNGDEKQKENLKVEMTNDTALKDNNKHTQNAGGKYEWNGKVSGIENLDTNYNITVNKGKSSVSKANLTVNLGDVKHQYGTPNLDEYKVGSVEGLTNGDTGNISVEMTQDNALKDNNKHTNNVGDNYTWSGDIESDIAGLKNNYDITVKEGTSSVSKANLTVNLGSVKHQYGTPNLDDYKVGSVEGLTNGDTGNISVEMTQDNALKDDNKHTNNVGDNYTWSGNIESDITGLKNNYDITVKDGKSTVNKADLTINLGDVNHKYGTPNLNDYKVGVEGLTNGDKGNISVENIKDSALKDNNTHTNNVGDNYTWSGDIESDIAGLTTNYNITVKDGKSTVSKAKLDINVNDVTISQGDKPQYSGIIGELVNGDTLDNVNIHFGVADSIVETIVGEHKDNIGIWIDGKYYDKAQEISTGLWKNYEISLNPGDLTVLARDWKSWETEDKYAWGKKREERERKAEIHFVDGGQIISEKVTK